MKQKENPEEQPLKTKIALYEDDLYSEVETVEALRQIVIFSLAEEWYGIDIDYVREVVAAIPITLLPFVPDFILGIVSLRGDIVSACNLRILFGLPGEIPPANHRLVVIRNEGLSTALVVDGSVEALEIPVSQFEILASGGAEKEKILEAQVKWSGKLIAVLDVKQLLEKTRVTVSK